MRDRYEGATLPGATVRAVDECNKPITNGADYTWTAEAALKGTTTRIWLKTTGFSPTLSGCNVIWADDDMGALLAHGKIKGETYTIEYTGVRGDGGIAKAQDTVVIKPEVKP